LEGIARIEALGYRRLAELGGPTLAAVRTVGTGARNTTWRDIRRRVLGVDLMPAKSEEAAVGVAMLALKAIR
jgi:sugar (pentulose or hexulose) kinase